MCLLYLYLLCDDDIHVFFCYMSKPLLVEWGKIEFVKSWKLFSFWSFLLCFNNINYLYILIHIVLCCPVMLFPCLWNACLFKKNHLFGAWSIRDPLPIQVNHCCLCEIFPTPSVRLNYSFLCFSCCTTNNTFIEQLWQIIACVFVLVWACKFLEGRKYIFTFTTLAPRTASGT